MPVAEKYRNVKTGVLANGDPIFSSGEGPAPKSTAPTPYTSASPSAPTAIAADSMSNPTKPYTVPGQAPTTPPDYYSKILASVPTISSIVAEKSPAEIAAENSQSTIRTRMMGVLDKLSGKTAAQQEAEAKAGLPDLQKNLTDVTSQIVALQNEAKAIPLEIQNESEGRGRTAAGVASLEAGRLRDNAIKALGLSSIAATLQGNIALAEQTVARTVAAEFDPLQLELDYLKQFYSFNRDALADADKDQAEKINGKLQERQEALDVAKADRTTVINNANAAAKNGAPAAIVSQALGLDLPAAMKLLSPYMPDPSQTGFTLSAGQKRYDAKGNLIAAAPEKAPVVKPLNGYKFTQGQTSQLLAGGFSIDDIASLQTDIATFGIDQTIEGLPVDQQDLIRRSLAGSDPVTDLAANKQFLNVDYLAGLFTDDELKTAAAAAGFRHWYTNWESEKQAYLKHLMDTVTQYRTAGQTDQQILASMQ